MRIWSPVVLLALVSAMGAVVAVACGNGAVGVQACREIETARCESVSACHIPEFTLATAPVPDGDPVAACVRYYNDACLHGLQAVVAPGNGALNDCVAAIHTLGKAAATDRDSGADCAQLLHPETIGACPFLALLDSGTPAVADTGAPSAVDAAAE